MPIIQNTALFSLLGTYYGGNGQTTYGLPNLQGQTSMAYGQGPGLQDYPIGGNGGQANVTIDNGTMATHTHALSVDTTVATKTTSSGNQLGLSRTGSPVQGFDHGYIYSPSPPTTSLSPTAISLAGGGQPHNNMQPYLTLNYCIALVGIFPPRP